MKAKNANLHGIIVLLVLLAIRIEIDEKTKWVFNRSAFELFLGIKTKKIIKKCVCVSWCAARYWECLKPSCRT